VGLTFALILGMWPLPWNLHEYLLRRPILSMQKKVTG
jgi:hypothetical protein